MLLDSRPGCSRRLRRGVQPLLVACGLLLSPALFARAQDFPAPRFSIDGDRLPPGALVQLGTKRFRHTGWRARLHFLPDNRTIVSTNEDKLAKLWDVSTGQLAGQVDFGDMELNGSVLFPNGEALAGFGFRFDEEQRVTFQTIRIMSVTGRLLRNIERIEPRGELRCIAVNREGTLLAAASDQGPIRVFEVATGREVLTTQPANFGLEHLAFSRAGDRLALVGRGELRMWDWATGETDWAAAIVGGARFVAFSPDGELIVTGSDGDVPAHIWRGKQLIATLPKEMGVSYYPDGISFTADGNQLAIPSRAGHVGMWDVATATFLNKFDCRPMQPRCAVVSSDGKWLAAMGSDSLIAAWNLETGDRVVTPPGHEQPAMDVAFSPSGKLVVTGSYDGTARVWDAETGEHRFLLQHAGRVRGLAVSPDEKLIASSAADDTLGIWDAETGRRLQTLKGHGRNVNHLTLRFSPAGDRLFSWGQDMTVRTWNPVSGELVAEVLTKPAGIVVPGPDAGLEQMTFWSGFHGGQFVPDGSSLYVFVGGAVHVMNVATGAEERLIPAEKLTDAGLSPDGKFVGLVSAGEPYRVPLITGGERSGASRDHHLQLLDAETGVRLHDIPLAEGHYQVPVFSSDGKFVAINMLGANMPIFVFSVETGRLTHRITGAYPNTWAIHFSPDGRKLVSCPTDTTLLIWDLPQFEIVNPGP